MYYSGTVAAVREAVLLGWPGIALSHYRKRGGEFDPHPLPLSYRHEGDGGMHYDGDYHTRRRAAGADVDVCFSGRIAVTRI